MSGAVSTRWWRRVWENVRKTNDRRGRRSVRVRRALELEVLEGRVVPSTAPVAYPDSAVTEAPLPVHIAVLANDYQQPGITLVPTSVTINTPPSHGSTSVSHGVVTYTPAPGFSGVDTFRYTVGDTHGDMSNAPLVTVLVERPTAVDDWGQTDGTAALTINVLSNDLGVPGGTSLNPSSVTIIGQPADGTATVNSDGTITYAAKANFIGTDVLRYTVADTAGGVSLPASVYVRVSSPTAQYAVNLTYGTTPVTVNVLAQASDPLGQKHLVPSSVTISSPPAHGVAVANSDGTVTYTANPNFSGRDSFSYTIGDDEGAVSSPANVFILVVRPVALDQWTDTDGTTPVKINVLTGASERAGAEKLLPSGVVVVGQPAQGTAVANSDGTITYTANPGFTGTDSFQFTISDDHGGVSAAATCYVRVNRPSAADLFATTPAGTAVSVNVLAQASDPDGNQHLSPAGINVTTQPVNGTVQINSDGTISYTPNANFNGTDTFQYTLTDDQGGVSSPATVSIVVTQTGSLAGVATQTFGNQAVVVNVLSGYTGPAHLAAFTLALVGNPSHGTATVDKTNGTITYLPTTGFTGTDTFQYTVHDSTGAVYGPATATVVVKRPVVTDDWTDTDGTTAVTLNVLANDSDPMGSQTLVPSSVTIASQPVHGTVVVHADGTITYQAATTFTGTDLFTYTVRDNKSGLSLPAHVYVRVNRPIAADYWTQTGGTTPVTVNVMPGASDPDGNQHLVTSSIHIVTPPAHGTAVVHADGSITYTANAGYSGTDVLQYTIGDNNGGVSLPANLYIRVVHPTVIDQWATADGAGPTIVNVLADATDPAGIRSLTAALAAVVSQPAHGTAVANSNGTITYTAAPGFSGTDSFHYAITDSAGGVSPFATVYVTVNHPTAANIAVQAYGTVPLTLNVLSQATNPGGKPLPPTGVAIVTQPKEGTAEVNADGTISYTAKSGYTGVDTFQYTVSDTHGATSLPATITVMTAVPVGASPEYGVRAGTPITIDLLAGAVDVAGPAGLSGATVKVVSGPQHGQLTAVPGTTQFTYTPSSGYAGMDSLKYTITDSNGAVSAVATVTFSVYTATWLPPWYIISH